MKRNEVACIIGTMREHGRNTQMLKQARVDYLEVGRRLGLSMSENRDNQAYWKILDEQKVRSSFRQFCHDEYWIEVI